MAVLANRRARLANAAEALIVDGRSCVVEGATSNVSVVRGDGTLVTPPESDGILLGITRETVLAVAARLGVPVKLESLPLDAVKGASEVFFCSSIRELMPVVSIDGSKIADGKPGPMTLRLLAAFAKPAVPRRHPNHVQWLARRFRTSGAAKLQLESQKLPWRIQATSRDRDFTGRSGDREFCEGERILGLEDQNKKYFLRGEQRLNRAGGSATPKSGLARLPISLLILGQTRPQHG